MQVFYHICAIFSKKDSHEGFSVPSLGALFFDFFHLIHLIENAPLFDSHLIQASVSCGCLFKCDSHVQGVATRIQDRAQKFRNYENNN